MSDRWTGRLSEYLDGELSAAERSELEAHLGGCGECSATVEQLRRVVARAGTLKDRAPAADLWQGIAERIEAERTADLDAHRRRRALRERRLTLSLPQLAAASIALMVLSGGTAWLASRGPAVEETVPGGPPMMTTPPVAYSVLGYNEAIARLERVIDESRDRLDTATVRVIEENLMIIDHAILQAQRALAADPGSAYLNEYLAATMRQKLEFLTRAAELTGSVI